MTYVFISYVREDAESVDKLTWDLRTRGVEVWLDREKILPGQRWQQAIRSAIKNGAFFIACFSKRYLGREKSYMNEELTVEIEELRQMPADRAWFIPVLLDNCSLPERRIGAGETLSDLQWVNMYESWKEGLTRLLSAICGTPIPNRRLLKIFQRALEQGEAIPDLVLGHVACPECSSPATEFTHKVYGDDHHGIVAVTCPNCGWSDDAEF